MLFSSIGFIYVFLPLTGLLFAVMRRYAGIGAALGILTGASLVFYGIWRPLDLPLFLASMVFNWLLSQWISPEKTAAKAALYVGIIANIALLFSFKYFTPTLELLNAVHLTHAAIDRDKIWLPLGISFFTFVQIAYLIDRCRGLARPAGFLNYILFVSFFPHLIAGPIVHHSSVMPQLESPQPNRRLFSLALFIFIVGLSKKVLIADPLGGYVDATFPSSHNDHLALSTVNAWAVALSYMMQLYFDFSGYSDMAVGLALMFGVEFPWNFLSPYKSTSISDFWRNWHVTLSNFLKDYVYIPLGGSRVGPLRLSGNLLFTMLVGAAWHGAGITFLLWGLLHGVSLVVNHFWSATKLVMPAIVGWGITMVIVLVGWVMFRADSFGDARLVYRSMLGRSGHGMGLDSALLRTVPYLMIGLLIALLMPNTATLSQRFKPTWPWTIGAGALVCLGTFFIFGKLSPPEFLYYQF